MVGLTGMSYLGDVGGSHVSEVAGLRIVLKRCILTVVVIHDQQSHRIGMTTLTSGGAVRIHRLQVEAALERPPAYILCVQQIAYVDSRHLNGLTGAREACIAGRLRIGEKSAVKDELGVWRSRYSAIGLPGYEVNMTR